MLRTIIEKANSWNIYALALSAVITAILLVIVSFVSFAIAYSTGNDIEFDFGCLKGQMVFWVVITLLMWIGGSLADDAERNKNL